jgi:hypothetical protein
LSLRLLGCSANFLDTETSLSVDLIVAGQRLLGFDSSKSSSTANVRWTCFIDIAVDGQSHSWAFYIDITVDGQRPLDFHLVDSSLTAMLTPGLFTVDGQRPLDLISSTHRRRPGSLLDFHHRHHRRWPTSAGLNLVDSSSTASVPLDFLLVNSSLTASVPLGLLKSTRRQRPACRWTSSR